MTNSVDPHALLLFLIIFVWTPPHFWALAIARRDDYAKAGIPMLPVTHGVEYTRLHVLLYTVLLTIVTLLPYLTRMSGLIYLAAAVVSERGVPVLRVRLEDHGAGRAADAGVQVFGDVSDVVVRGAADRSLHSDCSAYFSNSSFRSTPCSNVEHGGERAELPRL